MPSESMIYWNSVDFGSEGGSSGESTSMSPTSPSRHYVDPWDLENYAYMRRHMASTPEPGSTPSPAGGEITESTFYYLPGSVPGTSSYDEHHRRGSVLISESVTDPALATVFDDFSCSITKFNGVDEADFMNERYEIVCSNDRESVYEQKQDIYKTRDEEIYGKTRARIANPKALEKSYERMKDVQKREDVYGRTKVKKSKKKDEIYLKIRNVEDPRVNEDIYGRTISRNYGTASRDKYNGGTRTEPPVYSRRGVRPARHSRDYSPSSDLETSSEGEEAYEDTTGTSGGADGSLLYVYETTRRRRSIAVPPVPPHASRRRSPGEQTTEMSEVETDRRSHSRYQNNDYYASKSPITSKTMLKSSKNHSEYNDQVIYGKTIRKSEPIHDEYDIYGKTMLKTEPTRDEFEIYGKTMHKVQPSREECEIYGKTIRKTDKTHDEYDIYGKTAHKTEPIQDDYDIYGKTMRKTEPTRADYVKTMRKVEPIRDDYGKTIRKTEPMHGEYDKTIRKVQSMHDDYDIYGKTIIRKVEPIRDEYDIYGKAIRRADPIYGEYDMYGKSVQVLYGDFYGRPMSRRRALMYGESPPEQFYGNVEPIIYGTTSRLYAGNCYGYDAYGFDTIAPYKTRDIPVPIYDDYSTRKLSTVVAKFGLTNYGHLKIDYSYSWNTLDRFIGK